MQSSWICASSAAPSWSGARSWPLGPNQVPWCQRHGVVNLEVPEPTPDTCVACGHEPTWEMRDTDQGAQQMPVCSQCGVTTVHTRKDQQPKREVSWASFASPQPALDGRRGRPRGLCLGDIPGAVRMPSPAPRAKVDFLPPYESGG